MKVSSGKLASILVLLMCCTLLPGCATGWLVYALEQEVSNFNDRWMPRQKAQRIHQPMPSADHELANKGRSHKELELPPASGTDTFLRRDQQEFDKAFDDFSEAIRLRTEAGDDANRRGHAYNETGEYDKAIAAYTDVIRLIPNSAAAFYNRGYAYERLGEYNKAIADYSEAILFNLDFSDAYYRLAHAYNETGEYDKAIADYTEVIRLKPDFAEAYHGRGVSYDELGEQDKSKADFAKAKELGYTP